MTSKTIPKELFETILQEHRQLMQQINGLRQFWSEVNELGQGPKFEEMGSRIKELRDSLTAHFEDEECDGYLAVALDVAPRFTQQASELQRQHQQFLEVLDRFIERLQTCDPSIHCWQDARQEFEDFLDQLREHEQAENTIVQSAFTEDLSSGD